jgi:ribosomal protein S12 methylthiotransferase accessory factor
MQPMNSVGTPIQFGGRLYSAGKAVDGRVRSAGETMAAIAPYLPVAGITRLANIAGLDRIGVPVVLAIRPGAQTLATNAGKGLSLETAKVSAAAEGIEVFHAETIQPTARRISWREMERRQAVLDPERLALKRHCHLHRDWPHDWLFGYDLLNQQEIAVPFGMVSLAYSMASYDFKIFPGSSNGLASGNHLLEAILAGLLEVAERDAISCYGLLHRQQLAPAIRLDALNQGPLGGLIERLRCSGLKVFLQDYSSDTGIPVVKAFLADGLNPQLGMYHGQAAALSLEAACLKALLEAVQSRSVYIAGSRDDMPREIFSHRRDPQSVRALMRSLTSCPEAAVESENFATETLEGDIAVVMEALRRAGVEQIAAVELTRPDSPLSVVKVIVPGLEGYLTAEYEASPIFRKRFGAKPCVN